MVKSLNISKLQEVQGFVSEEAMENNTQTQTNEMEMVEMTNVNTMVEVSTVEEVTAMTYDTLKATAMGLGIKIKGGRKVIEPQVIEALGLAEVVEDVVEEMVEEVEVPEVRTGTVISAASETLVAEETTIEEEPTMSVQEIVSEIQLKKNEAALEKYAARTGHVFASKGAEKYEHPIFEEVHTQLTTVAERYLASLGEYAVEVVGIEYFARPDNYGRVGKLHVMIPAGYMEIKVWNKAAGEFEWTEFADHQLDQFRKRFIPPAGNGLLTLAIKENASGLFVRLPKTKAKDSMTFYDVVRTKSIKWGKGHSDNNANLEAALTAFVRAFESEFVQEHPLNRFGFNESCMSCRNMEFLQMKDGVTDDLVDSKSNIVLDQQDIPTLAQYGAMIPQAYCTVYREFVDQEAVEEANKATQLEKEYYVDEEGEYRWLGVNEILIAGKAVKKAEIRREGTASKCASCPFYHKNEFKGEHRIAKEKAVLAESGQPGYVSPYFTTRAVAERMPIQVLTNGNWEVGFPGEFEAPEAFRVQGLGGVVVYGSELMAHANPNFVAPTEDVRWDELEINKQINMIFHAAFNLRTLSEEQAEEVFHLAMNKPKDLSAFYSDKWDKAVSFLAQSLEWVREGKKERSPFAEKFTAGIAAGTEVITADDILTETRYRVVSGMMMTTYSNEMIDYKTLEPKEFVRYLDEDPALDLVYGVIMEGTDYSVHADDARDMELVAGALQVMLQRELNNLVYNIRREANREEALSSLRVCEEVKTYIQSQL